VRDGSLPYAAAVQRGLYRPLGEGGVALGSLVEELEAGGYRGWYVLEQDVMLSAEPDPGAGPALDVRRSLAWLEGLSDRRLEEPRAGRSTT
jgi:inosose dehydratase